MTYNTVPGAFAWQPFKTDKWRTATIKKISQNEKRIGDALQPSRTFFIFLLGDARLTL
jgi:hypothetical protein